MQSDLLSAAILLLLVIDPFGNVPLVVSNHPDHEAGDVGGKLGHQQVSVFRTTLKMPHTLRFWM